MVTVFLLSGIITKTVVTFSDDDEDDGESDSMMEELQPASKPVKSPKKLKQLDTSNGATPASQKKKTPKAKDKKPTEQVKVRMMWKCAVLSFTMDSLCQNWPRCTCSLGNGPLRTEHTHTVNPHSAEEQSTLIQ